eukprot:TRINITY_DN7893_c0_g1_i4.p2 TRINITY_DN7893_c0_g1~~TRINITY_DN7893_c0_g1_i4.p2  ORF type:complete len:156 (-),score=43.51 TRINITY_DN7893_c0_g1_i4:84-551(-)
MIVCQYGPAGNFIGRPIYQPGPKCSACQKCSDAYEGLCSPNSTANTDVKKPAPKPDDQSRQENTNNQNNDNNNDRNNDNGIKWRRNKDWDKDMDEMFKNNNGGWRRVQRRTFNNFDDFQKEFPEFGGMKDLDKFFSDFRGRVNEQRRRFRSQDFE